MNARLKLPRRSRLLRIRASLPVEDLDDVAPPSGSVRTRLDVIGYGDDVCEEGKDVSLGRALELRRKHRRIWFDFEGLSDVALIREVGSSLGLHHLTLEDVVHPHQRAKVEAFESYVYIVVRMVSPSEHLETEQLSIVLGRDFVLTFQEGKPGDSLGRVRDRLRHGKSELVKNGSDYLAYAILDAVIDDYFPLLERYAEDLERLEAEVEGRQYLDVVWQINGIKRELLQIHTLMLPQRDLVQALIREPSPLVSEDTRLHLRDIADHTGQLVDLLISYRDMAQALIEIHLNVASNRMNEVMQVLTIFGAIFMPLSFIAGLYGMNFDTAQAYNMPELHWKYGYVGALGLMAFVASLMLAYFYRKGWLQPPK